MDSLHEGGWKTGTRATKMHFIVSDQHGTYLGSSAALQDIVGGLLGFWSEPGWLD